MKVGIYLESFLVALASFFFLIQLLIREPQIKINFSILGFSLQFLKILFYLLFNLFCRLIDGTFGSYFLIWQIVRSYFFGFQFILFDVFPFLIELFHLDCDYCCFLYFLVDVFDMFLALFNESFSFGSEILNFLLLIFFR